MKKEKTILLGGLILILALGIYIIAQAALDVGNDLDMWPGDPAGTRHKIFKLGDPSGPHDAATWGYVKDAVNGEMSNIAIWRQDGTSHDVYLNDDLLPINLSGKVGIGTNDPSAKLHIYSTARGGAGIKLQEGNTVWSIYGGGSNNNLAFYSYDPDIIQPNVINFTHTGRIGIGTTAPRQHLSIGSYLDIYDGAIDNNLEYPSIRSSIENLTINGSHIDGPPDIFGGVYFNYDRGRGVKFFAHPSDTEVLEIASLNDNGDLHLNGTLNVDSYFLGTGKNYVYGKLGVGKMLTPTASLDVIADTGVSDIFKVSHLASGDFANEILRPDSDASDPYEFTDPACDTASPCYHASCSNHYQAVNDEPVSDADCSYIQSKIGERGAATDLFNIPPLTGPVSSIDYVKVTAVCKIGDNPNPAFVSPVIKTGGTIYTNETFTELNENYQTITFIANQNPDAGRDWIEDETTHDIRDLQIGVQARGGPVPPDGPGQNPTSFIADTQILMADGSYESIEKIKAGDKVISYDLSKKQFVNNLVLSIVKGKNNYLLINNKLGITLNQKIYIADKGFIEAREVKIGDYLLNESKEKIKVNSIRNHSKKVDVYDLVLKFPHNFFAEGYLVHNIPSGGQAIAASGVRCTQVYAEVGYFKSEPTTALAVDSAGNVGIGTSNPGGYILRTHSNGSNEVLIGDDLTVGGTTTTNNLTVDNDVVVSGKLSVSKTIKVAGTGSEACDSSNVGTMRYYRHDCMAGVCSSFQVCMQTNTYDYTWYTIREYSWSAGGGT